MAIILIAIIFIGFFGILTWVKSTHGLQWVQSRINTTIPGRIHFKSHRLSLFFPQLDLYEAVLYDSRNKPLAGFSRFHVRINVLALLKKELRIENISLESPWTDLAIQENGELNLMAALSSSHKKQEEGNLPHDGFLPPFNLVFSSISLTDGRATFKQGNENQHLEALGITLSSNGNLMAQSGKLDLEIPHIQFISSGIHPEPVNIKLRANLEDGHLSIPTLTLTSGKTVMQLSGTADGFPQETSIDAALSITSRLSDISKMMDLAGGYEGAIAADFNIKGKGLSTSDFFATINLEAKGRDLTAPGMKKPINADATLTVQLDPGGISISHMDATSGGTRLNMEGRFQLRDRSLDGKMSLTADDLSQIPAVAGIAPVSGAVNAAATVSGNLSRPQFSAELSSTDLKIDTYTLGDLSIAAIMDQNGRLDLTTLTLQNKGSHIRGSGQIRMLTDKGGIDPEFENSLHLTLENISTDDFAIAFPFTGTFDGRLQLDGPLDSLTGDLSVTGKALAMEFATIGNVDTRLRLENGTVFAEQVHLSNQDSTLTATGSIQLLAPGTIRPMENPTFTFTAQSNYFDPAHFIDSVKGTFTFNGELSGSLKKPAGQIALTGRQINLAGQPMEELSIDARIDEQRLWVNRLSVAVAPAEQFEVGGWLDMDRTMNLHLKSEGVLVSHIHRLKEIFPGDGLLGVDIAAKGNLKNPDIDGSVTVTDIKVNNEAMEDIQLAFNLHDMQAKVSGNLNFEMEASCDLKQGDFDARFLFDRTETAAYFNAAGLPDFQGTVTGQVKAAGNLNRFTHASVNVDMDEVHLLHKKKIFLHSGKFMARLEDQIISIPEIEATLLSSGRLRIKGKAQIDGPINMAFEGRIPLEAGAVFSDVLADAEGTIALEGRLSGNTSSPEYDAGIDLEKIGMTVPGIVQQLHDLNGSIHLNTKRIRIKKFSGFLDTGSFSMMGNIDHDNFEPVSIDIKINTRSLPIEVPDTLSVLINGDLSVLGKNRLANAKGTIILLEGLYYKDVNINLLQIASTATSRKRAIAPESKPITIPFFDTINLDIAVEHRQPFEIQNNLADLAISPDLSIGGSLANPIVSGRAQVRNGTVTFQRKEFNVKKGVIDFINPYKTEADIDIESEAEIRSRKINLALEGSMDNLKITLTSVPAETEADILSLILFGRTTRELTSGEGGSNRTTNQIMAEMIADTLGDDIKKKTGIDILELETTDSSEDNDSGGMKVTLGKHLSDRMIVKYAIETINGETKQWAIMEYKLFE